MVTCSIGNPFYAKGAFDTLLSLKNQYLFNISKRFKGDGGSQKPTSVRLVKLVPKHKNTPDEKCIRRPAPKPGKKVECRDLKNVVPNVEKFGIEECKKTTPPNPCSPQIRQHNPNRSRNIFLFVCLPLAILQMYLISIHDKDDAFARRFQSAIECPNFEYLHRRTKRFPWGDGKNSLFHNEHNVSGEECLAIIEQKKINEENKKIEAEQLKAKKEGKVTDEECEEEEVIEKEPEKEKEKEKVAKGKKC